jgi:DNA-directed RNA polymerase subunit RPC12/RpoP
MGRSHRDYEEEDEDYEDEDYEDDDEERARPRSRRRGFRCPYCHSDHVPVSRRKISAAGWVVFVILLLFCLPLFWIGLLITEEYRECSECGMKIGG